METRKTDLQVRAYHVYSVEYGEENRIDVDGHMTVQPGIAGQHKGRGAADQ